MENRNKTLLEIFLTFLRIGAFTFGGGYAMIPLIQKETVEKHGWISDRDILEIVAIAESTPGPIAVNSATFVGYRVCGFTGALCATLGVVLPSFLVITAIAFVLREFQSMKVVQYAFFGIRAGVLALILKALWSDVPPVSEESGFLCHCGRFLHPGGHPERQRASGADPLCRRRLSCIHHFLKEG